MRTPGIKMPLSQRVVERAALRMSRPPDRPATAATGRDATIATATRPADTRPDATTAPATDPARLPPPHHRLASPPVPEPVPVPAPSAPATPGAALPRMGG